MIVCEVPHLRLTDGSAWRTIVYETKTSDMNAPDLSRPPKDIDTTMPIDIIAKKYNCGKTTVRKWLVQLGVIKSLGDQAWEVYTKRYVLADVAEAFGINQYTARGRIDRYCRKHGLIFPKQRIQVNKQKPVKEKGTIGHPRRPLPDDFYLYANDSNFKIARRYKTSYEAVKRWLDEYKKTC